VRLYERWRRLDDEAEALRAARNANAKSAKVRLRAPLPRSCGVYSQQPLRLRCLLAATAAAAVSTRSSRCGCAHEDTLPGAGHGRPCSPAAGEAGPGGAAGAGGRRQAAQGAAGGGRGGGGGRRAGAAARGAAPAQPHAPGGARPARALALVGYAPPVTSGPSQYWWLWAARRTRHAGVVMARILSAFSPSPSARLTASQLWHGPPFYSSGVLMSNHLCRQTGFRQVARGTHSRLMTPMGGAGARGRRGGGGGAARGRRAARV